MIAAAEVTDCPSDRGQAAPLMEQVQANTGALPREMSADVGYFSSDTVQELSARGMEMYLPPDSMPHTRRMPAAPRGRIPADLSTADTGCGAI